MDEQSRHKLLSEIDRAIEGVYRESAAVRIDGLTPLASVKVDRLRLERSFILARHPGPDIAKRL
jgi:hypothetical protein